MTPVAPEPPEPTLDLTAPDTSDWITYVSEQYGFRLAYPPDWTVVPAERSWTLEEDAGVIDSTGQDGFLAANGDVWVTVWAAPYAGGETLIGVERWAQEHCREAASEFAFDCGLGDGAVPLCNEERDCHPGLLVPFRYDLHAYFTGGVHGERMTVAAVWRSPYWPVERYGTASRVLLGILSTMDVRPQP